MIRRFSPGVVDERSQKLGSKALVVCAAASLAALGWMGWPEAAATSYGTVFVDCAPDEFVEVLADGSERVLREEEVPFIRVRLSNYYVDVTTSLISEFQFYRVECPRE